MNKVLDAVIAFDLASDDEIRDLKALGQSFKPAPLPPDVRPRAPGICGLVATGLALKGVGAHVKGWAIHPFEEKPIRHEWVTRDGLHVIDPSFSRYVMRCSYFGIISLPRQLSEDALEMRLRHSYIECRIKTIL